MGDLYQVRVATIDEMGQLATPIIDLTGPADVLRPFVSQAVLAALGSDCKQIDENTQPVSRETESDQPKRRRRTKAEMEAARLADQQVTESAAVAQVGETADTVIESGSMPSSEAVTTSDPAKAEAQPAYNPFS